MAMFVRAELFDLIGLIDEEFFAYGEENDFQIRVRKAGYCVVAVNVAVWHYGQGSFGKIPMRGAVLQTRNNIRLLIKHATFLELIRAGAKHLYVRILRQSGPAMDSAVEQRLRPLTPIRNFVILVSALLWNCRRLPRTLGRRREDNRRAARAKRKLIHS
jgi:GT2 family glycosyltransferase